MSDHKKQLTLSEFIRLLEGMGADKKIRFDFANFQPTTFDSYRGYYNELALGYDESHFDEKDMTVGKLAEHARSCIGKTFQGWKGGDFKMTLKTPLWVANSGECHSTQIVGVTDLRYMAVVETRIEPQ